jgi:hypothetical protein
MCTSSLPRFGIVHWPKCRDLNGGGGAVTGEVSYVMVHFSRGSPLLKDVLKDCDSREIVSFPKRASLFFIIITTSCIYNNNPNSIQII